ncbi:cache domain-containing protein [Aquabacterium sp. A7-Y]|uniref:cache domain-containing protein n=1 Tax=Aquabacterium sp. A7-Y TaxID=1349605 RepID=UPI00223D4E30|nr:cache domain-containing protein [Aquabacterium sp. A7-Y]MCW7536858.1 cache domain-containing protein [Aquabacterium sp. A7-Y]
MKWFAKLMSAVLLTALSMGAAQAAGEKGTAKEAEAMTKKAVAYYKEHGAEKAFAEFNKPDGQFRDRDLYIFVYDKKGTVLSIGSNPKLIGKNLIDMKDVDGKPIIRGFIDIAFGPAGKGWWDYKWPNPVTKAVEPKSSYIEGVGDVLIGCGIYK